MVVVVVVGTQEGDAVVGSSVPQLTARRHWWSQAVPNGSRATQDRLRALFCYYFPTSYCNFRAVFHACALSFVAEVYLNSEAYPDHVAHPLVLSTTLITYFFQLPFSNLLSIVGVSEKGMASKQPPFCETYYLSVLKSSRMCLNLYIV